MFGHLRIRSPWSQLGALIGVFLGFFVLSSVIIAMVYIGKGWMVHGKLVLDWSKPEVLVTMKWLQGLSSITIFLLPALLWSSMVFGSKPFYFLGFKKAQRPNMYLLAVVCILAAFPLVFYLGELNQQIPLPEWMTGMEKSAEKQIEAFLKPGSNWDILVNVIVIGLLPAVCEELFFRGALQRIMIRITKSPWWGIVITGMLFSALHMQFQGFFPRMFLGILLGALYWYSGSIWTNIAAHFTNNAVQVIAVSFAPGMANKNPSMPILAALVSGALVFIILFYFDRNSTITWSRVYETHDPDQFDQFLG